MTMKRNILLIATIILCALGTTTSYANETTDSKNDTQTTTAHTSTTLKGIVKDLKTGETLAGAQIMVNGQLVYSDLDGYFSIDHLVGQSLTLHINMISYAEQTLTLDASTHITDLNIDLEQL